MFQQLIQPLNIPNNRTLIHLTTLTNSCKTLPLTPSFNNWKHGRIQPIYFILSVNIFNVILFKNSTKKFHLFFDFSENFQNLRIFYGNFWIFIISFFINKYAEKDINLSWFQISHQPRKNNLSQQQFIRSKNMTGYLPLLSRNFILRDEFYSFEDLFHFINFISKDIHFVLKSVNHLIFDHFWKISDYFQIFNF